MTTDAATPGWGPTPGYPPAAPDSRMPGIGAAAAVLGFVEAGFGLALVAYLLVTFTSFGGIGSADAGAAVVLLGTIAISALLLLGSLFLARRTGRRLLLGTSLAEVVVVLGLGIWALADSSSGYDPYSYGYGYGGPSLVAAVFASLLVGLALPVVRLSLAAQPAVSTWLRSRQPAPPVWSPEAQQWVVAPRGGAGTVLALLAPVALVLAATIVVLTTSADQVDYADGLVEPGVSSDWSYLYDGGDPVEPPASDDPEFDTQYDDDAQACYDGDLGACDDLYSETDVGTLYEWLGSTCGGREEYQTYGSCE